MPHFVLVAATTAEIADTIDYLNLHFQQINGNSFLKEEVKITVLITGVGLVQTTFRLTDFLNNSTGIDGLIQAGIGGVYAYRFPLGTVVEVMQEQFGDLGVEDNNKTFMDMIELGFLQPNIPPFKEGILPKESNFTDKFPAIKHLQKAIGNSVNKGNGSAENIDRLLKKYPAIEVESMEGAAFFYVCRQFKLPFLQIRAISNDVEARNRANWQIGLAIKNLNTLLIESISTAI
ncbi:MAG: hypothetical protein RI894_1070 [Bacteroidota bacterium]|jgi:futalosine hydrolase